MLDYDELRTKVKKLVQTPSQDPTKLPLVRRCAAAVWGSAAAGHVCVFVCVCDVAGVPLPFPADRGQVQRRQARL
jgi:hypothetical protein